VGRHDPKGFRDPFNLSSPKLEISCVPLFLYITMGHAQLQGKNLDRDSKTDELVSIIIKTINENKPQSVKELVAILRDSLNLEEGGILKAVLKLQAEGVIKLENQVYGSRSFIGYVKTVEAIWYWVTVAVAIVTAVMIFIISEAFYPWIYLRNAFGLAFILFLPGYAFVKAVFPISMPIEVSSRELETIERIVLSVGLSLALVPMVGLVLYYTPLGIGITPIVLSLLMLTLFLATIGAVREHKSKSRIRKRGYRGHTNVVI
jgi:hypothetical protein